MTDAAAGQPPSSAPAARNNSAQTSFPTPSRSATPHSSANAATSASPRPPSASTCGRPLLGLLGRRVVHLDA